MLFIKKIVVHLIFTTELNKTSNDMKDKIIKLLDDWKVNKHKQELMAEELLFLFSVVNQRELLLKKQSK